ncbi:alcohol dehydrogenase [acceptor]-like [Diorhabda carinulata]|uniref:alcohol dehydrogenase [acceptor]-like n=1 Tax=Diorhabda carinulata TaxID=1163345 RepID=UPI0025A0EBAA|nr:alcohol dehydrogenase [acceptor]-like [Diorhabda carinulata]
MIVNTHSFLIFLYMLGILCFEFFINFLQYNDLFLCYNCEEKENSKTFDYIVVGFGSAGAIVSRRLAENKSARILVLEAGKYGNTLLDIPSFGLLLQKSAFDWQYKTVAQKNSCFSLYNNKSIWPMGKIVGGTARLNNMLYVRGHPEDFNSWFRQKEGYSFEYDILPYFKRLEQTIYTRNPVGSIYVSNLTFQSKLPEYVLNAAKELGYFISNETENCMEGFGLPKVTLKNGQRWTPAHTLLELNKPNIIIRTGRTVEKVLLRNNFEAYGVKYSYKGQYHIAKATKGVILSAGVVGTTKILLHSGIGQKKHLDEVNIETKINLPVGENLQDHLTTGFDLVLLKHSLGIGIEYLLSFRSLFEYFWYGIGPWTTVGCDILAYFNTEGKHDDPPDLQLMVMPLGLKEDNGLYLRHLLGITDETWNSYFNEPYNTLTATILPVLLHPKSRGNIRLQDNKFSSPILIDPKYLTHAHDVDILIKGLEIIRKLVNTEAMKKLGASFNEQIFPPCKQYQFSSREYWSCYVRHITITSYHPVGTCKMGPNEDENSVVNFNFEVIGTNNLFVVDGSVIPSLTSGNIIGTIFILAEMASDVLKYRDFLNSSKCEANEIFIKTCTCQYN